MADPGPSLPSHVLFYYTVSRKLTYAIFLLWKQQIKFVIKAHRLQHFVVTLLIPPQYLTIPNFELGKENSAYSI